MNDHDCEQMYNDYLVKGLQIKDKKYIHWHSVSVFVHLKLLLQLQHVQNEFCMIISRNWEGASWMFSLQSLHCTFFTAENSHHHFFPSFSHLSSFNIQQSIETTYSLHKETPVEWSINFHELNEVPSSPSLVSATFISLAHP